MTTAAQEAANRLLDAIGDALRERGVTLDELIEEGREERGAIFAEKYGLAGGYSSVPALTEPKTDDEIAAIVADERAERYRVQEQARAWETIQALRTENAACDPDEVFADVTEAVATVRRESSSEK